MVEKINYKKIVEQHPWVVTPRQKCVLSPDVNGLLSGLLMSHYLSWEIVGFYDGKELRIKKGLSANDCIFVDVEIFRKNIRSIGHHMIAHNNKALPEDYYVKLKNCINPNYIRGFDRKNNFARKYPLGTVHFLLFILSDQTSNRISIDKKGFGPIFFADGIWKILFKYTANFLDWFDYLETGRSEWWEKLRGLTVIELIKEIKDLFVDFRSIHPAGKKWYGHIFRENFNKKQEKEVTVSLLRLFGQRTGWAYKPKKWYLDNMIVKRFTKKIFSESASNSSFLEIWKKNPLSFAMTQGRDIEYTIEEPDKLL